MYHLGIRIVTRDFVKYVHELGKKIHVWTINDEAKMIDLIDIEVPVLLEFYIEQDEFSNTMHPVLKDVADTLGKKAKVIKIDIEKNNISRQDLEKMTGSCGT